MREMTIDSIRINPRNYQRVVILKEKDGERYLPIWIGPAEADAIAVKIRDIKVPRPLTHDLLRTVIETMNASVKYILVSDLQNETFYAKIVIQAGDDVAKEIDCRPSDAIALAIRVPVSIYVEEAVLDKAGILLDKETGMPISGEGQALQPHGQGTNEPGSEAKPPTEEELERRIAFEQLVEGVDLGDFGKGKEDNPNSPS